MENETLCFLYPAMDFDSRIPEPAWSGVNPDSWNLWILKESCLYGRTYAWVLSPIGNIENFEYIENGCPDPWKRRGAILQKIETANVGNAFTEMLVSDDPEIIMEKFAFPHPQIVVGRWSDYSVWKVCYYDKFLVALYCYEDFWRTSLQNVWILTFHWKCIAFRNVFKSRTFIDMPQFWWIMYNEQFVPGQW